MTKRTTILCPTCDLLTRNLALGRSIHCPHEHVRVTRRRGGLYYEFDTGHEMRMHGPVLPMSR